MAFMKPEYLVRRAWHIATTEGIQFFFASTPFDVEEIDDPEGEKELTWFADLLGIELSDIYSIDRDTYPMVYCRLSAPGFMDATDWSGPFETEKAAQEHISDMYDVDPITGNELDDIVDSHAS